MTERSRKFLFAYLTCAVVFALNAVAMFDGGDVHFHSAMIVLVIIAAIAVFRDSRR
jgi:hypothetical protein